MYYQVSIDVLVDGCAKDSEEDEEVGGRRLSDRLGEPGCVETRLVASRLLGKISAEEFAGGLEGYGGQVRGWLKAGREVGSRCGQEHFFHPEWCMVWVLWCGNRFNGRLRVQWYGKCFMVWYGMMRV